MLSKKEKTRIYNKTYKEKHKEQLKGYQRKWQKANPEKVSAQGKRRYAKHKNRILSTCKKYYKENKEKVLIYQRMRRETNPQYALYNHARRRAKFKGLPFTILKEDIIIPKICPLLKIPLIIGKGTLCDNSPTIDRLIQERGYIKENIVVVSYKANRMKSNSSFEEFERLYRNWSKIRSKK